MFIRICDTIINLEHITDLNYVRPSESDPVSRLTIFQAASADDGQAAMGFSGDKADALWSYLCATLSPAVVPFTPDGQRPTGSTA